jgi:hypothetical protein
LGRPGLLNYPTIICFSSPFNTHNLFLSTKTTTSCTLSIPVLEKTFHCNIHRGSVWRCRCLTVNTAPSATVEGEAGVDRWREKNSFVGLLVLPSFATEPWECASNGPFCLDLTSFFAIQLQHEVRTHNGEYEGSNTLLSLLLGDNQHSPHFTHYILYFYIHIVFCTDRPSGSGVRHCLRQLLELTSTKRTRSRRSVRRHLARGKLILMYALLAGSTRLCESGMCPPRHQNRMIGIILIPVEIKDWKT